MPEDAKEAIDRYIDEHGERRPGHDVAAIPMDDDIVLLCPEDDLDVQSTVAGGVKRVGIDSTAFIASDTTADLTEER